MKTSKIEVAAVKEVSKVEIFDGLEALVRSTIPGTKEYEFYRARLDEIHEMALRLMGRKS